MIPSSRAHFIEHGPHLGIVHLEQQLAELKKRQRVDANAPACIECECGEQKPYWRTTIKAAESRGYRVESQGCDFKRFYVYPK